MNIPVMTSPIGFGTLIIGLIVAIVLLLRLLRMAENRDPTDDQRERKIEEMSDETEQGGPANRRESHRLIN